MQRRGLLWITTPLAVAAVAVGSVVATVAARAKPVMPAQAAWSVQIDLPKFVASQVGRGIVDRIKQQPKAQAKLDRLSQTLGLDITKDIDAATIYGQGFTPGSGTLVVQLGKSTGNLAGWMLTLPGYQSEELSNDTMLHSFNVHRPGPPPPHGPNADKPAPPPPADQRVFVAMPEAPDGHYLLVASRDKDQVVDLAKQAVGGADLTPKADALTGSTVLKVRVGDLSDVHMPPDRPGSAIVQSIQKLGLAVDASDTLGLSLNMTADSAARANQLAQLINGVVAATQFRAEQGPADAASLADLLEGLRVSHDDGSTGVSASLSVGQDQIDRVLDALTQRLNRRPPPPPAQAPPPRQDDGGM